jgi:glycosyltransferase 2 family protein
MKIILKAILGIAFGGLLLWLAISRVDLRDAATVLESSRTAPLLVALAAYWIGIAIRVLRWQLLLRDIARLSFLQVARALVVGYAVNNVLPARIGELFRVDYLARRFQVARSAALGSVILERVCDGIIAVVLLMAGLNFSRHKFLDSSLGAAAVTGALAIAAALLAIILLVAFRDRLSILRAPWLVSRFEVLVASMSIIHRPVILGVAIYSMAAWCLEAIAVRFVLSAFSIELAVGELCLVFGAAALSTLLPSAPGYVGSLQVAFVIAFSAIGIAPVLAIVSSTATQIFLFGSITIVGLTVLMSDHLLGAASFLKRDAS